ncbi:hypothetical protein ES702_06944 [subsurface metagenome]
MTETPDLYILEPILAIFTLVILMVLMIFFYNKKRLYPVILVIYLFSLVIGMAAMEVGYMPFSPYLQIFFLLIQTVIFVLTSVDLYTKTKK